MSRRKKLLLNSTTSIFRQVVLLANGFVIPYLFINNYGSAVNGLISSITQFLGFISLAELGVGAVVQSAFYKPLAERNNDDISSVFVSSERFFRKVGYILAAYTLFLCLFYHRLSNNSFDIIFNIELILIISISSFAQYYIGMTYRLLLNSDQMSFIQLLLNSFAIIASTICAVILVNCGADIRLVKLVTSLFHLSQPIILKIYVDKHYSINKNVILTGEPIKQKWHGLSQHIASVILTNTDVVVLTICSSLENVSIYSVYHLIVGGVQTFITSATTGVQALLGELYAKKEEENLHNTFQVFECVIHFLVTLLFTVTGITIIPFVRIYTYGVNDANYIVPTFAVLIVIAQASYSLRLPYNLMVLAAGHFKETEKSAIVEAIINITVSLVFVFRFNLVGVAIGTVCAMVYRTIYLSFYIGRHLIKRTFWDFVKHIAVDLLVVIVVVVLFHSFSEYCCIDQISTYYGWALFAFLVALGAFAVSFVTYYILYKKQLVYVVDLIFKRRKGSRK